VGGRLVAADAWRLRKARTLVKLLVLADGHRMHRESLVALLWPDRDTASGINNLHQALYVARRVLAPGSGVLFPLREDVVLLSDSVMPWLDVEAFGAACRRARETRAPGDYRSAGELYRGDLLPEDQFEAWAEAPRDALRERRLGLLIEYAEVLSERREYTEVAEIAGAVTAADPFHEGAYRLLMTALAARGRRYEALAAFDRLRESLTREFAADPEPATRRLYRDLLTGGDQSPDAAMATEPATAVSTALALSRTVATTAMTTGPAVAIRPDAAGHRAWRRARPGQSDPGADVLRRSRTRDRRDRAGARAHAPADPDRAGRRGQDAARVRGCRRAGRPLPRRGPCRRIGVIVATGAGPAHGGGGAGRADSRHGNRRGRAGPAIGGPPPAAGPGQLRTSAGRVCAADCGGAARLPGRDRAGHQPGAAARRRGGDVAHAIAGPARSARPATA
jgi:DNA-binding transcriptional activator of the SARP family